MSEISFCFEELEIVKKETEKGTALIIDAEKEFLLHNQYLEYLSSIMTGSDDIELAKRHFAIIANSHNCTSRCKLRCLAKATKFKWNGKEYISTGDVWVCPISCIIHMCGQLCSTKTSIIAEHRDGEVCCLLTGSVISKIYSTGTKREEDDFIFSDVSTEIVAPLGFESTMLASRQMLSASNHDVVWELRKEAECDPDIAEYVSQSHRILSKEEKIKLCKVVKNLKQIVESEYNRMILSESYEEYQSDIEKEAKKKCTNEILSYINACIARREAIDFIQVIMLFYKYEFPIYDNVYLNVDTNRMKKELKYQVVWQIIDVWLKLSSLPIVEQRNISLKDCVLGFLYYMSSEKGLVENIAIHAVTKEPMKLMDAQLNNIPIKECIEIVMIPRVPGLVLASISVIKAAAEGESKKASQSRYQINSKVSNQSASSTSSSSSSSSSTQYPTAKASPSALKAAKKATKMNGTKRQRNKGGMSIIGRHSNRIISPGRAVIPGQSFNPIMNKVGEKGTRILPGKLNVQQLYNDAVSSSKSVEQLLKYCIYSVSM